MMLSRRRLPLLVAFPAIYVGIAAMKTGEARPSAVLLVLVAVAIAYFGARAPESDAPELVRARLWTATGLSLAIATSALSTRPPWAALAREVAALFAMIGALGSIHRITGDVGLAAKASEASAMPAMGPLAIHRASVGILVLAWGTAILTDAIALFHPTIDPVLSSSATIAAVSGVIAMFALGGSALLVGGVRHLELAVPPRALACAGVVLAGLLFAIVLALADLVPSDGAVALGSTTAAALVVPVARYADALLLARRGRRLLTLVLFGGPVAALAALASTGRVGGSGTTALVLTVVAVLVGVLSPRLEEPFLPVKGSLLDALADARKAAAERETRTAMAHALVRIREACARGLGKVAGPSPELWLLHPTRVLTVDAAGYLQERVAEMPDGILEAALGEPYGTLRTSVLRALEVRRADLRPLLAWLEQRDAISATVIAESEDPDGLLVVPSGARLDELTLEEVRAAKRLADSFVAIAQATSAKERHLARELDLKKRIEALDDDAARLEHTIALEAGRHGLAATRLAGPGTVGFYSASSRMAYDALERRIARDAPAVILARPGIDPVPWVARAHLAGPRKAGPFVVVDGTSSREHDVDRWNDERTSPLALADRGLLFLVDGAALPFPIQVIVARAIVERRAPWERATPLDIGVAVSAPRTLEELVLAERMAPVLAARFEDAEAIVLPRLRERPEDLSSIVADRLAREGLRAHGRPLGIDASAFGKLVEHGFDGEDAELVAIVTRLALRVHGDVVRAGDVDALGLATAPEGETQHWVDGARADATGND